MLLTTQAVVQRTVDLRNHYIISVSQLLRQLPPCWSQLLTVNTPTHDSSSRHMPPCWSQLLTVNTPTHNSSSRHMPPCWTQLLTMNTPTHDSSLRHTVTAINRLQCFDVFRWASGRASVKKLTDEVLAWLSVCSKVQMICIWSS